MPLESAIFPKVKRVKVVKEDIGKIPETPGVYIFWSGRIPIYIGKAVNLKNRLLSYFGSRLGQKTSAMVSAADSVSVICVSSEIEALLLEAELVWKHKPRYNSALKDDKHPLYIMITKGKYPRVVSAKHFEIDTPHLEVFGPFISSTNMRYALKLLRPIFPYSTHKIGKRKCIYSQIGLCKPCPSEIELTPDPEVRKLLRGEYLKNIKNIKGVFSGKIKSVRNKLEKEMLALSKNEMFEEAQAIRKQVERLDYITRPVVGAEKFIENPNLIVDIRQGELDDLLDLLSKYGVKKLNRIECFDVAHLAGTQTTASMVTFIDGTPDKCLYRHFRIRQRGGADDIKSLEEVALRRESRLGDWGRPDLIIVDGGKGQVMGFLKVFSKHKIPVVGIAKRFETLIIAQIAGKKVVYTTELPTGEALNLIQRIRDEAHRFARAYHHRLIKKSLIKV